MVPRSLVLALASLIAVAACKREERPAPAPTVAAAKAAPAPAPAAKPDVVRWYRAALAGPDGDFVFFLGLAAGTADHPGRAILQSGVERLEFDGSLTGKHLRIDVPVYQVGLEADLGDDGALRGVFRSTSRSWGASTLPLVATPVAGPTPDALALLTEGAPLEFGEPRTIWKLDFPDPGVARLELEQRGPGAFAAVLSFTSGNTIYLAGDGRGERVVLTGFDGTSPYRLALDLAADRKAARGDWQAGQKLDWRERVTAARVAELTLPTTQPGKVGARLEIPQVEAIAELRGKPVMVEMAGSWCSTCKNAAPALRALYQELHPRGLEIVTLLYEFTDDEAVNREQAARFQQAYDIPWKVVAVTGAPEDLASFMPPGFDKVDLSGFPIALFLDRDRRLSSMHAGFPSAELAAAHDATVAAYRASIEKILAPTAPAPAP